MIYPAKLDLVILQGATFYKQVTWKTGDGQPFDLAGAEIRMQARYAAQADEVLLEATTDNGHIVIEDGANGVFSINLPASLTDTFSFPKAIYDLEVATATGTVYRLLEGRIRVEVQVTR